jgi:hypothetical protein
MLQRVFVKTLPPALSRPFMVAGSEERKEFLDVMQAQVFPYMPASVLADLGDRQRLRMLTAKTGSPQDLVKLNRVLRQPITYGEGELPTYALGPQLDRLLPPEDRQVGPARLPMPPTLCEVSLSRKRLTLKVSVDPASAAAGRLRLGAWLPGSPDFVDLGPEVSRADPIRTFKISARRFLHDEYLSSNGSGNGTTDQRQWILLLQAEKRGTIVAASPIMVPTDTLRAATTKAEETRDGRIQIGATPRGSVVVTVKRARRLPAWHRPRLVV